jgi:hypothetical protein
MNEILQFEAFAPDARDVRSAVVNGGFATHRGPDGADYTGISMYPVPHWFDRIAELISCAIIPKLSCFRLNLDGELPHSWVHSDDICAKFATVLYLNLPHQCQGGTAFWKHSELGIDRLPPRADLKSRGIDDVQYYRMIDGEWKKREPWQQVDFVKMKWNRFITYPTCLFHSRFPFEGFGSGPADGRLIWICFYDKET